MNKLFSPLSLLLVMAFLLSACTPVVVDVAQAAPAAASYQAVLGKPASDESVSDFIASNNCAHSGSFELCPNAGLALWMDRNQVIQAAYLYARAAEDFSAYKGELPFGLASNDSRADAERKLGQPKEGHAPQAGWAPGLPDEGSSPDNEHFWAIYKRFGLTIIYDTPSANDRNAKIHAILVKK
jgi:hypothetical protein